MKIVLEVFQATEHFGIAKQNRHFNLVKLLNNYAQFKNSIIYHDKTRSTERCNEFLTIIEIK